MTPCNDLVRTGHLYLRVERHTHPSTVQRNAWPMVNVTTPGVFDEGPVFDEELVIDENSIIDEESNSVNYGKPISCSTLDLDVKSSFSYVVGMFPLTVGVFKAIPVPVLVMQLMQCLDQTTKATMLTYLPNVV
jgi:hypothetical protein